MKSQKFPPITSLIWCNFFVTNIQNYIIGSIPNKRFSGYQLLSFYYVSWALAVPEHVGELGLEYESEFEMAVKMASG